MPEMIAYCGIKCHKCPTYIATLGDDEGKRVELAAQSRSKGLDVKSEDINCEGCKSSKGGVQIAYCSRCKIRSCARSKGYDTCAECTEFESCKYLKTVFKVLPHAKAALAKLRETRG